MGTLQISGRRGFRGSQLKVNADPLIIFVCGYWHSTMPYAGKHWDVRYWGTSFRDSAKKYFGTQKEIFINGAGRWHSSGGSRFDSGKRFAEDRFANIESDFYKAVFKEKRKIMIVSHSMGAAYSEGMLNVLVSKGVNVQKVAHLSPADTSGFSASLPNITYQIDIDYDPVLMYKNLNDATVLRGIIASGIAKNPNNDEYGHMYTKSEAFVWNWFEDLERVQLNFVNEEIKIHTTPGTGMGYGGGSYRIKQRNHTATNLIHNSVFKRIMKNGKFYFYDERSQKYYTEEYLR